MGNEVSVKERMRMSFSSSLETAASAVLKMVSNLLGDEKERRSMDCVDTIFGIIFKRILLKSYLKVLSSRIVFQNCPFNNTRESIHILAYICFVNREE